MVKCECKIIDTTCDPYYHNENHWPDWMAIEPKLGHHVLSNDGNMIGNISNIIHYRKKSADYIGTTYEDPLVILEISSIKNFYWR